VSSRPTFAMLIEQVGKCRWRSAIACLVEHFREVVTEYFQHFDENASLKPPWLGEERVRDFIVFSFNRT